MPVNTQYHLVFKIIYHINSLIICSPGIATGYTLLLGMAEFVGTVPRNVEPTHEKFADLYLYVGEAAPFGRPIDVNVQNIKTVFLTKLTKGQNVQAKEKVEHYLQSLDRLVICILL